MGLFMKEKYTAESIEVLRDLKPVQLRPGMYTDTSRPNHLAQEAIDNSVDEAIAGFATQIDVTLYPDNSLEVADNGRGMPVDLHPEEKVSGVEVIMTRLHAGAKFSQKNYKFSGGLHGVGVSVVNALSTQVDVTIKREAKEYHIRFSNGETSSALKVINQVSRRNTGTKIRFWPNSKYFDSHHFLVSRLKLLMRSKAVLCPGLKITFNDQQKNEKLFCRQLFLFI